MTLTGLIFCILICLIFIGLMLFIIDLTLNVEIHDFLINYLWYVNLNSFVQHIFQYIFSFIFLALILAFLTGIIFLAELGSNIVLW